MKYLKYFENQVIDRDFIINRKEKTANRFKKSMKMMSLSDDQTINYVIENCSEWIDNPVKITRSINSTKECFYSEPVRRFSTDNPNEYTLLMDNLPDWKLYPKRSKSFICTLGNSHMSGNMYYIIPLDGSKWGVAPEFDIFHCFKKMTKEYCGNEMNIPDFFVMIRDAAKKFNIHLTDSNYTKYKKQIIEFNKIIIDIDRLDEFSTNFYRLMEKNNQYLWESIVDVINPKNNGFKLLTIPEIYNKVEVLKKEINEIPNMIETWTDSPCIFIYDNYFDNFLVNLEQKIGKKIEIR
jgi:hypothetical protein